MATSTINALSEQTSPDGGDFFPIWDTSASLTKKVSITNLIALVNASIGGAGTVTSASVVSANGFAGTVANATTTPAITLTTSVTGVLKGNGTAMSAAVAGTDYVTPTGAETLTNKTITGASVTGSTALGVATGSFDMRILQSGALTGNRNLTFALNDNNASISFVGGSGAVSFGNNFTTSGNWTLTLTTTANTNVTMPTTGTLATLAGSESLSNKTLVAPDLGTPASGNLSSCTADGTNAVGFRTIPQNSQSAAYTTVLADSGKHIHHPSTDANARTFTIDSNANVAYPVGTAITFINETSQVVTIAITADTLTLAGTTTTGSRSLAQNGVATAIKVTSTKWIISGTGLT